MIPFNEMAQRLKDLGKDRAWLSQVSGRKPDSIRVALAKNAPASKRSPLIQKALSDPIERAEAEKREAEKTPPSAPSLPDRITLFVEPEKHALWDAAAKADATAPNTAAWAVAKLNAAAAAWASSREIHLLDRVADAADGENSPSRGATTYPDGRSKRSR